MIKIDRQLLTIAKEFSFAIKCIDSKNKMNTNKNKDKHELGLNAEVARSLLPIFFEEIMREAEKLENSIEKGKSEEIKNCSHKIKGTSQSYRFPNISKIADKLEQSVFNQKLSKQEQKSLKLKLDREIKNAMHLAENTYSIDLSQLYH